MKPADIKTRANALAPWHHDFELLPGFRTGACNKNEYGDPDKRGVSLVDAQHILPALQRLYPNGLGGKDVLDIGCNAGGYCFIAAELGAKTVAGFDIREHWITQAEFVKSVKYPQYHNIFFKIGDAKRFREEFGQADLVIFKGIFYHLPDPIHVLFEACAVARETILINTATDSTVPENCLSPMHESRTFVMSGVDGLAWRPGGPAALRPILEYAGFPHMEVNFWDRDTNTKAPGAVPPGWGRMEIIAHRREPAVVQTGQ